MKERLINNLGLKLLSLGLAFVIWLAVVNISNPEVTRSKTVDLEVRNASILTNASKSYTISNNGSVNVNYQVRTRDEYKIKASDFKAYIDLANLYSVTGSVQVNVEVTGDKELIIGTPFARPSVIQVSTEDVQKKKFALSTNTIGTPEDGYSVGSVDADPSTVVVTGPVSLIGRISSVGIEVNVDRESKNLSGTAAPVFYDANGNRITISSDKVTVDPDKISYTVNMLRGKSLKLNFNVSGNVADGYRYTGAECNVKSVPVKGKREILDTVSSISIPEGVLSVQGATGDRQVELNVADYLPDGITVDGESKITVTLKVEALNRREFNLTLNDLSQVGQTVGYSYMLDPGTVTVEVTGLPEDLNLLKAADLNAEIDFTHLSKGPHEGTLTFNPPKGCTAQTVTPFRIIVYDANGTKPSPENGTAGPPGTVQGPGAGISSSASAAGTGKNGTVPAANVSGREESGAVKNTAASETAKVVKNETAAKETGGSQATK